MGAIAIEDVEQVVEHEGDLSTRSRTQKKPRLHPVRMSQGLTGEKGLATTTGVGCHTK